ncbi:MAG: hypothetical protein ACTHJR_08985 [Sphingomonas sp.]
MRNGFCLFWLVLLLGVIGMLALGGQPDPPGSGQTLDGPWRFHAGDDPAWASPATDDRGWEAITLVSRPDSRDGDVGIPGYLDGWRARGHPALEGYGWYRRRVTVPPQGDLVLVGPPSVDDGYEMFWNGRPIGGIGTLSGAPKVNTTRPFIASVPAAGGDHVGVLAIRTFMQPGIDRDTHSGGLRTVPVLAPRPAGEALYRAQWRRTIAGYVVDAAEPPAMLVLALIAIVAAPGLTRPAFARWVAAALAASALLRLGNALSAWTDLLGLPTLLWQNDVILAPLAKLGWTMAWNQWTDGRDRRPVAAAAMVAWVLSIAGALSHGNLLAMAGRALFALSLIAIAVRIGRHGQSRSIVLPAMLLTATGLFAADLSALGVPSIWFPFDIGVSRSQYAYALALPLLAWALATADGRSSTPRSRQPSVR